jgi:hypothetical protein
MSCELKLLFCFINLAKSSVTFRSTTRDMSGLDKISMHPQGLKAEETRVIWNVVTSGISDSPKLAKF